MRLVIADIDILTNTACFLQKKGNNTPRGKTTPNEGKEKTNFSKDDFKVNPVSSLNGVLYD